MYPTYRTSLTFFLLLFWSTANAQVASKSDEKSFRAYDVEISKWMVAEATADTSSDHELAVIELARLYTELASDPRIVLSPTLNQYRVKLRGRLMKILRELEIRITRKLMPFDRSTSDRLQSALERHLAAGADFTGGARHFLAPRAGAGMPDYGPHLVALIQRTIAPEFWDINGGPGVIVYYPPLRLLVVRATSQVHGRIRNLNNMLH
ncbi:MAG: hypothetical protein CMJ76_01555 [Planctomycetaceae bacterium]|nr:hypothetical protein [Planctomycetaceae bacterium]